MKKIITVILTLVMVLTMSAAVYADDGKAQTPSLETDYYMIVESPDGGINIYPTADASGSPLNSNLIPNGYPLHILGEITGADGSTWGYVPYHGMNGYVPLEDLRPATEEEAINAALSLADLADVDYSVITQGPDGKVYLYEGPGTNFDLLPGTTYVANDETLPVFEEAATEDGGHWGETTVNDQNCWINLDETDLQGQEYTTATPGTDSASDDLLDMQAADTTSGSDVSEEAGTDENLVAAGSAQADMTATPTPKPTSTPTPKPTATNTPTPKPTATNTPTPKPTATNTPTPEPTATNTPTPKPTATNTPTPKPTATNTPEPTATNTPEPTATNTPEPTATNTPEPTATAAETPEAISSESTTTTEAAESTSEESETTTEAVSKSSTANYIWIIAAIAVVAGFIAVFTKMKKK